MSTCNQLTLEIGITRISTNYTQISPPDAALDLCFGTGIFQTCMAYPFSQ